MILAKCGPEDNIEVALTLPNICTLYLWTDPVAVKTVTELYRCVL